MSIFRVCKDKDNPYLIMNKSGLQDKNLSWKAKGILAYLLSLPDDWRIYESEITQHSADGIKGTSSGIKELIKAGYIKRETIRSKEGHFKGYEYQVFEVPTESLKTENGFSENGKRHTTNNNSTNKDIKNKELYVIKNDDCPFLSFYLAAYEHYQGKKHMRVSAESLEYIRESIDTIKFCDVSIDDWKTAVNNHFQTLPESNNGNILAFLKASFRYFEIDLGRAI